MQETEKLFNGLITLVVGVVLMLSVLLLVDTRSAVAFDGGDGSPGDPYEISSCADLQDMELDLTASYELVSDIDCSVSSSWNSGAGFDPIGYDSSNRFSGTLEGNGYVISDFTINRPAENYNGIIGYGYQNIELSNFSMIDVSISGAVFTGSVIGYSSSTIALSNIDVSGTVTCTNGDCGGIGGSLNNSEDIADVHADVVVEGDGSNTGGAFGYLQFADNTVTVTDSSSSGLVTGTTAVGGFVGQINYGTFTNVSATGNVVGDKDDSGTEYIAGGFAGQLCNGVIENSFATGDVSGHTTLGGFVGRGPTCSFTIRDSYSRGDVTPSVAGFGGSFMNSMEQGTVTNSYSTGSVDGQTNGGFIYDADACTSCLNNFYDTQTSSQSLAGSDLIVATGKTTAEMKSLATFTNTATTGLSSAWDFEGTPNDDAANDDDWKIDGVTNDGYPFLTSQKLTPLILSISPSSNASNIAVDDDLVMNFNTPSGASSGYINIYRASDNQLVEAIDVAGGSILGNGTTTLTIGRNVSLQAGTTYYVLIDSSAIRANNGIYFAGISSPNTWQFTTAVLGDSDSSTESDTQLLQSSSRLADTGSEIRLLQLLLLAVCVLAGGLAIVKSRASES